jgi:hypothetical protein
VTLAPGPRRAWLPPLAIAAGLLGPCAATALHAEPAFAVRTGHRCSQCHVNRTGGGLRNAYGSLYTQTVLPRRLLRWREGGNLLPADPDARFRVGADVRAGYHETASADFEETASFELTEANAYGEVAFVPDRFSLYLDETVGPGGASTRELFALWSLRTLAGHVKVGKFLPAYGWRLPDDAAFVRQSSGFTYSAPDTGVEVGFEPGRWSLQLSATNGAGGGSDDNRSKRFTLAAVRRFERWRAGVSAANNIVDGATITHAGLIGGGNLGRLALLAEGDWVETTQSDATEHRLLGLIEADLLVTRGVNVKLAHDWIDPDLDVGTDARTRSSVGVEIVPVPFVQLRWFARRGNGPPQVPGSRDDRVELEAHVFF